MDVRAMELRRMPAMELQSPYNTSSRTLPSGALASTGPQTLVGVTYDAAIAIAFMKSMAIVMTFRPRA